MLRKATAAMLLAYLAWAAVGSVFAGEHLHREAHGVRVHSHALTPGHSHDRLSHHERDDHRHRHHEHPGVDRQDHEHAGDPNRHHESETDAGEQSGDSSPETNPDDGKSGLHTPPHLAESLLAGLANTTPPAREQFSVAPTEVLVAFASLDDARFKTRQTSPYRTRRIHAASSASPVTEAIDSSRFARPPPSV